MKHTMSALWNVSRSRLQWTHSLNPKVSLDAAGLVALADLTTVAQRTALTGNAALLDLFVMSPGLHRQQEAMELNLGEYPAVAALRSGYVFRVENPATVFFLQKVSKTGCLTTLEVFRWDNRNRLWPKALSALFIFQTSTVISTLAYLMAVVLTVCAIIMLALGRDFWGLSVLVILIFARLLNVLVIRLRCYPEWQGQKEHNEKGDLLILISHDRWVRVRGLVDDLKAVTSGSWLRKQSFIQSSITAIATVLVYLDAALASNVDQTGKVILLVLLIVSAGLLAIANESTDTLLMHGCKVQLDGPRKRYGRRLHMVEELLQEDDRVDWAMRLGMSRLGMTVDNDSAEKSKAEPSHDVMSGTLPSGGSSAGLRGGKEGAPRTAGWPVLD
jgi:hypothetical protein